MLSSDRYFKKKPVTSAKSDESWAFRSACVCLCVTSGLSDLAGPQGVWDAARRTLHHPRERRRSLGGVRRRAQSALPPTFHHGPQSGWHGGGPLVPQELLEQIYYGPRSFKGPFFFKKLSEQKVFPSRSVYHGNGEKLERWRGTLPRFQSREDPVEAPGSRQVEMLHLHVNHLLGEPPSCFCTKSNHSNRFVWFGCVCVCVFFLSFFCWKESQTVSSNVNSSWDSCWVTHNTCLIKMWANRSERAKTPGVKGTFHKGSAVWDSKRLFSFLKGFARLSFSAKLERPIYFCLSFNVFW